MQRRTALKNIGFSFGTLALSSTVVSLLGSCQTAKEASWIPEFFSQEEASLVSKIVDVMLPTTETPGAKDLNITQFMDGFIANVLGEEERQFAKAGFPILSKLILDASGKTDASKISNEDVDVLLNNYLRADEETQEARSNSVNEYMVAMQEGGTMTPPEEGVAHTTLNSMRELAIFAFKNTEVIGETVLAYAPVPGQQEGCVDLQETTGGKAWSL